MNNGENFKNLVNNLIKRDSKYDNELNIFVNYLNKQGLLDHCFDLTTRNIDKYFDSLINVKIGSPSALNVHIAALSSLFEYLTNEEKFNFRALNGHINSSGFRNKYLEILDTGSPKMIIPTDILNDILYKMDIYLNEYKFNKENEKYYHLLIARLYIKLSLLIPLKPGSLLALKLGDIKSANFSEVIYNDISIKIPKSVKGNILEIVDYAEAHYNVTYNTEEPIFEFLYTAVNKKTVPSQITNELKKLYKAIDAKEMLKTYKSGIKNLLQYSVESYKKTAIFEMLSNGVNIVYLKQLTGLDINTLLSDYDLDDLKSNIEMKSFNVNSGLTYSSYYTFL